MRKCLSSSAVKFAFWFAQLGWIQYLLLGGIFTCLYRLVSIRSGKTPSLNWASRFLTIKGRHSLVQCIASFDMNGETMWL